jgi:hypothetical protein
MGHKTTMSTSARDETSNQRAGEIKSWRPATVASFVPILGLDPRRGLIGIANLSGGCERRPGQGIGQVGMVMNSDLRL